MTLSTPQLKIAIEEKIKLHERSIKYMPWGHDSNQIEARISVYKQILEGVEGPITRDFHNCIDDNTPDCNCKQHKIWHWCPRHGWCNPVTGVGM